MIVTAVLLKVGPLPGTPNDFLDQAALEAALPSLQKVQGVVRAWVKGDEIWGEVEVTSEADKARIFSLGAR
jgi:hypothetical protein